MRNLLVLSLAVLGGLTPLACPTARAQYPSPLPGAGMGPGGYGAGNRGPMLSPYLNILRGRNFGIDYYLGTRSLFQIRSNQNMQQAEIGELAAREARDVAALGAEVPVQTGTTVAFGNTLGYYNNPVNFVAPAVGPLSPIGRGTSFGAPPRRSR
jgi:hypothetical protein